MGSNVLARWEAVLFVRFFFVFVFLREFVVPALACVGVPALEWSFHQKNVVL